jgi:cytochrome c553
MRRTGCLLLLACAAAVAVAAPPGGTELAAALAAVPDPGRGATIYSTCAACHGPDGGGVADGTVPMIGGQPQRVIVKQLVDLRHAQRHELRMEHFADRSHLEDAQQIADVAAYAAALQPAPRLVAASGDGRYLAQGTAVWFRDCERCHGVSGRGDGEKLLPVLGGQHRAYLERQMRDSAEGRRPNMDAGHATLLRKSSPADIAGIADYLSRIQMVP